MESDGMITLQDWVARNMKPDMGAYEVSQRLQEWNEIMNDMEKPKTFWQRIKHSIHLDKKVRATERFAKIIIASQTPQRNWLKLDGGKKS